MIFAKYFLDFQIHTHHCYDSLFYSAQEVKAHSFFKGVDWQHVYLQKVLSPQLP